MTKPVEEILLSGLGNALKRACKEQADRDLHNSDIPSLIADVWTEEDRERLAADYLKIAIEQLEYVTAGDMGWDPWIVVRAVNYVASSRPPRTPTSTRLGSATPWRSSRSPVPASGFPREGSRFSTISGPE